MDLESPSSILEHSPQCVVREQEDRFVLYNPRTDELHLLSPQAHYVYQLCDGTRDVAALIDALAASRHDADARGLIVRFVDGLVSRGLLRWVDHG